MRKGGSVKTSIVCVVAACLLALQPQAAFAYITLNGTVPAKTDTGGGTVVIIQQNNMPGATGIIKFKFSAPAPGSYGLSFCIGPSTNPCGLPTSFVVTVNGGHEQLAVVNANVFATNVLVVGQGTSTPIPFSVTME
jgi:hypothetical protein